MMNRRKRPIAFGMILLLCPVTSNASEEESRVPDLRAVDLIEGDKAPFSGQLLTPDLALTLALEAEDCPDLVAAGSKKTKGLCLSECEAEKAYLREKIPPWFLHPAIVAALSATVGALIVFGAVK